MELHENETKILLEELQRNIRINSRCSVYFKINGEKVEVDLEVIATFDDYNNFDGITRIIKIFYNYFTYTVLMFTNSFIPNGESSLP